MITQENTPYTADEIKAMVKTIEELRKKYNGALERAKRMMSQKEIEYLFPELKVTESEDDKIKKEIVDFITSSNKYGTNERCEAWLNWFEKQGEQKPADKIGPKFRPDDWITDGDYTWKIVEVKPLDYILQSQDGYIVADTISYVDEYFHLWSINDTKDGDLIYVSTEIKGIQAIFHKFENGIIYFHCNLCSDFTQGGYELSSDVKSVHPLSKTQHQKFFQKMKEAGYEWRQEEKKLIKINESKFKEEDYIVPNNITSLEIWKVINIDNDGYYNIQPITNIINTEDDETYRVPGFIIENDYRLWAINDAKDGDVLVDEDNNIGLYLEEKDDIYWHSCIYLGCDNYLHGFNIGGYHKNKNTKPASKEQRKLLFQKMTEEGYEWDSEKKELKKIEPKFNVDEWIVTDDSFGKIVRHVDEIRYNIIDKGYAVSGENGLFYNISFSKEHKWHKWTIQDAEDGDVLAFDNDTIVIFKDLYNSSTFHSYCHIEDGLFDVSKDDMPDWWEGKGFHPATKEQRELLFTKMREAGYEWNTDKKELTKQILKITPKFCVGQLITDNNGTWYRITNIKCLDDWYYELYDVCEERHNAHLELCSIIDEKFRENRFVGEIKKMMGD